MVYVYEKKKEFVGDPIILQSLTPYREGWGLTTDGKYLISRFFVLFFLFFCFFVFLFFCFCFLFFFVFLYFCIVLKRN